MSSRVNNTANLTTQQRTAALHHVRKSLRATAQQRPSRSQCAQTTLGTALTPPKRNRATRTRTATRAIITVRDKARATATLRLPLRPRILQRVE
jgi:hypothetical protein